MRDRNLGNRLVEENSLHLLGQTHSRLAWECSFLPFVGQQLGWRIVTQHGLEAKLRDSWLVGNRTLHTSEEIKKKKRRGKKDLQGLFCVVADKAVLGVREMALQVKVTALRLTPWTHMVEGENRLVHAVL